MAKKHAPVKQKPAAPGQKKADKVLRVPPTAPANNDLRIHDPADSTGGLKVIIGLPADKKYGVCGHVNGDPLPYTIVTDGVYCQDSVVLQEVQGYCRNGYDFNFLSNKVPTDYGYRVFEARCDTQAGGTDEDTQEVVFLPSVLKVNFYNSVPVVSDNTCSIHTCGNANQEFTLSYGTGPTGAGSNPLKWGYLIPAAPSPQPAYANYICFNPAIFLLITAPAANAGTITFVIKSAFNSPQAPVTQYLKTGWDYQFPVDLSYDNTITSTACNWPAQVTIYA